MLTPFERGLIAHLIADWLLQNDWMSRNKTDLTHPSSWVHGGIHIGLLSLALGWEAGIVLGLFHILVDTRVLLAWWRRVFRQTSEGPVALQIALWIDQVVHIAAIGIWVAFAVRPS